MSDEFDPFDPGTFTGDDSGDDPFDPFDPGGDEPFDPGGDDPGGDDPWGDDPFDPGGDDPGGDDPVVIDDDDPGGSGGSTEESVYYEQSFTDKEYYGSGAPSSVPDIGFPNPYASQGGIRYTTHKNDTGYIRISFSFQKNSTTLSPLIGYTQGQTNSISGKYPLIRRPATNGGQLGDGGTIVYRSWSCNAVYSNGSQAQFLGPNAKIEMSSLKVARASENDPISSSALSNAQTLDYGFLRISYSEVDQNFIENFGRVIANYGIQTTDGYWIYPPTLKLGSLESSPSQAGTLTLTINYTFYDVIPYCTPPTLSLSSNNQRYLSSNSLSPASVTLTMSNGYQLLTGSQYNSFQVQRRSTTDGRNFSAWESVSMQSAQYSTQVSWQPAYYYKDGNNVWQEGLTVYLRTANLSISNASPNTAGAYYQYRAKTLPSASTPSPKYWINYYVAGYQQGEPVYDPVMGWQAPPPTLIRSHWTLSENQIDQFDQGGNDILSPWSDTVQCQRIVTITNPSDVRVEPSRGRKEVKVSWKLVNVAGLSSVYRDTIDYYIKASYTNDSGTSVSEVVFKATIPAINTGRGCITFTNDTSKQDGGVLKRLPSCTPPKNLSFTVIAVYGSATSDASYPPAVFQYIKGGVNYFINNEWKACAVYYHDGNTWRECTPYYHNGTTWVECGT